MGVRAALKKRENHIIIIYNIYYNHNLPVGQWMAAKTKLKSEITEMTGSRRKKIVLRREAERPRVRARRRVGGGATAC